MPNLRAIARHGVFHAGFVLSGSQWILSFHMLVCLILPMQLEGVFPLYIQYINIYIYTRENKYNIYIYDSCITTSDHLCNPGYSCFNRKHTAFLHILRLDLGGSSVVTAHDGRLMILPLEVGDGMIFPSFSTGLKFAWLIFSHFRKLSTKGKEGNCHGTIL